MMPKQERQDQLLEEYGSVSVQNGMSCHCLTSCQWLDRRFVHSENAFIYDCGNPEGECHKTGDRGVANKSCLTDPYDVSGGVSAGIGELNGEPTNPFR